MITAGLLAGALCLFGDVAFAIPVEATGGRPQVDAAVYFRTEGSAAIEIRVPVKSVLMFSGEGLYVTEGRPLVIEADTVVLERPVTIRAFAVGSEAAMNKPADEGFLGAPGSDGQMGGQGGPGGDGAAGDVGRAAPEMRIAISRLIGEGNLVIANEGEAGARGQDGGRGGRGGMGGNVDHASCGPLYRYFSEGGRGGNGEHGGNGGSGGNGGAGGNVTFSEATVPLLGSGRIVVSTTGGPGGAGGVAARGGEAGAGGRFGRNDSLGCSADVPPGSQIAPSGFDGPSGTGSQRSPWLAREKRLS